MRFGSKEEKIEVNGELYVSLQAIERKLNYATLSEILCHIGAMKGNESNGHTGPWGMGATWQRTPTSVPGTWSCSLWFEPRARGVKVRECSLLPCGRHMLPP